MLFWGSKKGRDLENYPCMFGQPSGWFRVQGFRGLVLCFWGLGPGGFRCSRTFVNLAQAGHVGCCLGGTYNL